MTLVGVAQVDEPDLAERGELGARADRADHEARPVGGGVVGGHLLGEAGRLLVHRVRLVGDAVLGEHGAERAERGGLDRVDADVEVLGVHLADEVGAGEHEVLVAALERGAAEVVGAEVLRLDPGAERAVEHEHALAQSVEEVGHS